MKKGQIYEGYIERIDFPNKCRVNVEGEEKPIAVKGGIPGQKVKVSVNKVRKDKAEGRILEVVEKASNECEPSCPHFGECGGCAYQNLPYEEQLKLKESMVRSLLDGVCDDYIFEGIKGSPVQTEYRNKMEFSFGDEFKDGPLALGMHKKGSFYDLVTVRECTIIDADYRKILSCTLDYFAERGATYYHRLRHEGFLRHLLVRKGAKTGEILIDLITTHQNELDCEGWKEAILGLELEGTIAGILHTYNDSVADAVKDEGTEILYGQDYFYEELLGLKFRISPFSFFQTNSLGAEVLYSTARDYIGDTKGKVIFDLYSGTGTIAQILAPVAEKVVGVEIVEEAVEAARVNAKLNGLEQCSFIAGDVLKVLDTIEEKPDLIVLDPPRDGINPKALGKILRYGVDRLIYISCKPTSLARDLESFLKYGYKMEKAVAIDQFPGTVHVETVCLLGREIVNDKNVEYAHVDYEPKDAEYLKSAKGSASYREIKEWIKEQHDVSVSNLYIAQVKDKLGFEKRENYNKGADGHRVPNCPTEKEKLILEAFKHFRMI